MTKKDLFRKIADCGKNEEWQAAKNETTTHEAFQFYVARRALLRVLMFDGKRAALDYLRRQTTEPAADTYDDAYIYNESARAAFEKLYSEVTKK